MSIVGSGGPRGCSNHLERGTCGNRRTVARDAVLDRVLLGLKERLLAPALVEEYAQAYVAEVNAANRERRARQRWIVERTIGWISRNRRLARDFERHCRIAAAFVRMAMIRIMLRRLAAKPSASIQTSRMGSEADGRGGVRILKRPFSGWRTAVR